jgi:hypothetical protein
MHAQHCPHCQSLVAESDAAQHPPAAMACPRCRLIIGPGRCKGAAASGAGASSSGSAAGMLVNAARRAEASAAEPERVVAEVRAAAAAEGVPVERLRLIDYDTAHRSGRVAMPLAVVLRTFGTWRAVCHAAVDQRVPSAPRAG